MFVSRLSFVAGLAEEGGEGGEDDRRGDAAGGGRQAARERAEQPALRHGLRHALRQRIAEAGQRDGCARAAPVDEVLVDADGLQQNARHDVAREDARGCQLRAVDENLPDGAEQSAAEKRVQIFHQKPSFAAEKTTAWQMPGMLSP